MGGGANITPILPLQNIEPPSFETRINWSLPVSEVISVQPSAIKQMYFFPAKNAEWHKSGGFVKFSFLFLNDFKFTHIVYVNINIRNGLFKKKVLIKKIISFLFTFWYWEKEMLLPTSNFKCLCFKKGLYID